MLADDPHLVIGSRAEGGDCWASLVLSSPEYLDLRAKAGWLAGAMARGPQPVTALALTRLCLTDASTETCGDAAVASASSLSSSSSVPTVQGEKSILRKNFKICKDRFAVKVGSVVRMKCYEENQSRVPKS